MGLTEKQEWFVYMILMTSSNAILQSIMNSDAVYTSSLCHHWRNLLNTKFSQYIANSGNVILQSILNSN